MVGQINTTEELEFLLESNFIENVRDLESMEDAIKAWEYLKSKEKLTTYIILQTHKILMKNQPIKPEEKGDFRNVEVTINGNLAANYRVIDYRIEKWLERIEFIKDHSIKDKSWSEKMSKSLHIQYEHIHPFVDGNGRTGRMFMNWWRLKRGLPILVIYEKEKEAYYQWF